MKFLEEIQPFIIKFISMLLLILLPVREVMISVSVLVILDLITGLWAARKNKEPITSSKLKKTVSKTFIYQLSIIVAFIIEYYLLEGVPVVKVVAGLIAMTEGKSFFENIHRISGIDFWTEALKKIQTATIKVLPESEENHQVLKTKKTLKSRKRRKPKNKK